MLWISLLWTHAGLHHHNLFLLLLISCVEAQQQQFIQTTATLSQARGEPVAASLGELVFFAGGGTSFTSPSDRVDIHNVTNGSWTTATLSVPRTGLAATTSGNLIFFAGGTDALNINITYNIIDIYNISDGSWSTATLSIARCGLGAASVRDLVLFGGGYTLINSSLHQIYHIVDMYNTTVVVKMPVHRQAKHNQTNL
jgi:hypothetical protein